MSDVINLATFEFDTSKIEKNLSALQDRLFEIQKSQKKYKDEQDTTRKSMKALSDAQEALISVGAQESDAYKENTKALEKLEEQQKENFKAQQNLNIEAGVARKEYQELIKVQRTLITSDGQRLSMSEAISKALSREVTNKQEAKQSTLEAIKLADQLNPLIEEEAALLEKLNAKIDENTQFRKDNGSETEQQALNVGNYTDSITAALEPLNLMNGGLGGFIQRSQEAGGVGNLLGTSLKGAATGMLGMVKASLAFIATPIGAILAVLVGAFLLIQNAMNRSEAATNKLKVAFAAFSGIINTVLKFLEPLGEFLIDGIVAGFELAGEAAEKAMALIADGLEFIGLDQAAEDMRGFTAEVKEGVVNAQNLARAEASLEAAQRRARLTQLEFQKDAEKLRQLRDDETKSMPERIKANEDLGKVLKLQLAEELAIAKQALVVANLRIKAEGATKETLDAQAAALTEIADIQERVTGQESEQLANRNALQKEAHEKALELMKKRQEAMLRSMNEELDLFIQQQGFREKTLEEQLNTERKYFEKRKAILQKELDFGKITRTKYNTEILALQNDLGRKTAELTVQNAELELEAFKRLNDEKYLENQRLNDSLFEQESTRLYNEVTREQEVAQLKLDQGIINKAQFNEEMLALDEAYFTQQKELEDSFIAIKEEDRLERRAIDSEARLLELNEDEWGRFEAQQEILDEQRILDQVKIDERLAKGLITEENYQKALLNLDKAYAKQAAQIDDLKAEYKLSVAATTFGNLATIAGKESAAGKAFAIAQTTIDTYQSATAAYKSLAGIPVYGPALGGVAAAAAVVSGIANVKKIVSTKTPGGGGGGPIQGLATGGEVKGGFAIKRSNGDDRLITAKTGEVILTTEQRSFIGDNVLSLAGVPGFATGGVLSASSSFGQTSSVGLMSTLGNAINFESLATAVENGARLGAEQGSNSGSSKGLRGLSDDRSLQVQASF